MAFWDIQLQFGRTSLYLYALLNQSIWALLAFPKPVYWAIKQEFLDIHQNYYKSLKVPPGYIQDINPDVKLTKYRCLVNKFSAFLFAGRAYLVGMNFLAFLAGSADVQHSSTEALPYGSILVISPTQGKWHLLHSTYELFLMKFPGISGTQLISGLVRESKNHRRVEIRRDDLGSPIANPLLQAGSPKAHYPQSHPKGFEYPQRRRLHHQSGQPVRELSPGSIPATEKWKSYCIKTANGHTVQSLLRYLSSSSPKLTYYKLEQQLNFVLTEGIGSFL